MQRDWPETLKNARKRAGLTQQGLADAMGVNRSLVAQVETGRSGLGMDNINAWCRVCGIELVVVPADDAGRAALDTFQSFMDQASPAQREAVLAMMTALT